MQDGADHGPWNNRGLFLGLGRFGLVWFGFVCRTVQWSVAGLSINRNGAPANRSSGPSTGISHKKGAAKVARLTQATVSLSGESLKLLENPADRILKAATMHCNGSLLVGSGQLTSVLGH